MAVPPGKVPILETVAEAFAFLRRDYRQMLPVAAIGAALYTPFAAVAALNAPAPLLDFAAALTQVPVAAAYYRRTLTQPNEPMRFRLGMEEARLALVYVGIAFVLMLIALVGLMFVMGVVLPALLLRAGVRQEALQGLTREQITEQVSAALSADGVLMLAALGVLVLGVLLWIGARLSLAAPATIAGGKARILGTWEWTRGNALRIMAVNLIVGVLAFGAFILALTIPMQLLGMGSGAKPSVPAAFVLSYISGFAGLVLGAGPMAAAGAYLFKGLRPNS